MSVYGASLKTYIPARMRHGGEWANVRRKRIDQIMADAYREATGKEPTPVVSGTQWAYGLREKSLGGWTKADKARIIAEARS